VTHDPLRAPGFDELVHSAPELALVLASYGIDGGKAPQLDMRMQQSFFGIAPAAQLVQQLLQGGEPSPQAVAASSLPPGTKMRVDARTGLAGGGSGRIEMTSWIVSNDAQATASMLHAYSVLLAQVPGETVDVLQYVNYQASVYRIVSIEKVP
jgi:hypothetical protein